jgi:uncharacterized membrane protein YhhN
MLRAFFMVGALVFFSANVVAWGLLWLGQSMEMGFFDTVASTLVVVALLVWFVAMIGGITYRVVRYFVKPS